MQIASQNVNFLIFADADIYFVFADADVKNNADIRSTSRFKYRFIEFFVFDYDSLPFFVFWSGVTFSLFALDKIKRLQPTYLCSSLTTCRDEEPITARSLSV